MDVLSSWQIEALGSKGRLFWKCSLNDFAQGVIGRNGTPEYLMGSPRRHLNERGEDCA